MANLEFRPLLIGLLLTGLFAVAILNAGILLAINNDAPQSIGDDPLLSEYKINLEKNLSQAKESADATEEAIGVSPITLTTGALVFDAIGGIWKTMKEVPVTVYNLTFGLASKKLFGDDSYGIVLGILAAILTITLVLAVWKMVTTGESG